MSKARQSLVAYALIAPALLLFALMAAGPFFMAIGLSFCDYSIRGQAFVGLANFMALAQDRVFLLSLRNTLLYVLGIVPAMQVLALVLALAAHSAGKALKRIMRAVFYLLAVTGGVLTIGYWRWLWQPVASGGLNTILRALGLHAVNWYARPETAFAVICATVVLWSFGTYFILYLAALDGQPQDVHDAAKVDGANGWQRFRRITLPLLRRVVLYQLVLACIGTAQVWEAIALLTGGGPGKATYSLGYYLFTTAYAQGQYGMASAVGVIELALIGALVALSNRIAGER
jgi:multiple sugar transport system permease protein